MASLTVWKFETPDGAQEALNKLVALSKQQLITIGDAAIVTWPVGAKKPKTKQAQSTTGPVRWAVHSGACSSACSSLCPFWASPSAPAWAP